MIAQAGAPLPTGWKSGVYKPVFGQFTDVRTFVAEGGQQGVQRPVLPPGAILPLHPVAFLVLSQSRSFGLPVNDEYRARFGPALFGLEPEELTLKVIEPLRIHESGAERIIDIVGIVETLEGEPLPSGDIACRMGRFDDVRQMEAGGRSDAEIADVLIGNQNERHNNYQDYQKFLDSGGRIGLQHDPLLYGSYALNPYLVRVQTVPMLVVRQGEVAVIKAAVGQPSEDTSGDEFKFGSIVRPGHRGIWEEPLRTGKYAINPRIYQAEMVPTAILTLNWAEAASQAHNLDKQLKQIVAKSKEGFIFNIDLQVQIHVSDKLAPKVISMVGTMQNLVNEVLQAVVGNYFRDTLQGMAAVQFIENRAAVQTQAQNYIADQIRTIQRRDARRVHPGRGPARGDRPRPDTARDRQPGEGHVPRATGSAVDAHRHGEAGRARGSAAGPCGLRGGHHHQGKPRAREKGGSGRRSDLHRADRPGERRGNRSGGSGPREGIRRAGPGTRRRGHRNGQRRVRAGEEPDPLRARHPGDGKRR